MPFLESFQNVLLILNYFIKNQELLAVYLKESKACVYTKNLYMNVLSSIIHNSPRAETTQVSIHK